MTTVDFKTVWMVYVEWVDSSRGAGWLSPKDAPCQDLLCKSVGWLVSECDESITISASLSSPACFACDPMTIPRCSITKYEVIEFVKGGR